MRKAFNFFSSGLRRDLLAGGAAGLAGGLVFWGGLQGQNMTSSVPGLLGIPLSPAGTAYHLLASIFLGAVFGGVVRYQPRGYASNIGGATLYGLLWWIAGPITFGALIDGRGPGWSVAEASEVFPSLVGHLLYGGITGLGFYLIVLAYSAVRPQAEPAAPAEEVSKKRVVILGGGFGGVSVAKRLEGLYSRNAGLEITLISESNYLLFTPMLAEVASSGLEAQHISAPIRASCPNTRFIRAEVMKVDQEAQQVWTRSSGTGPTEAIPYDHLVLALGSVPNYFDLPGLEGHSFSLKSLEDAIQLRNHVIALLEHADSEPDAAERARQLTFVVAGGGFAGTETIAELFDLVRSVLRFYPSIQPEELRFVLVHSRDSILPELSFELAGYALRKLQARGIEFALNTRVTGARAGAVLLGEGKSLATSTLIWTAGNQPNPLLRSFPCDRNRAGAVIVDESLRLKGLTNVWAVGDCAEIPDPDRQGQAYPPTAQHALREGKVLAENIAAVISGKPPKPFRFRAMGVLVGLGHRTAAAEIRGLRFSGLLAWLMWRSIYLSKLPGMEKKVRVSLDWAIDLFFPRDIVLTSGRVRAPPPTPPQDTQLAAESRQDSGPTRDQAP